MLNFISFLAFGLGGQNGLKLLLLVTTDRALTVQLKDCQPHAYCVCASSSNTIVEEANLGQEELGNKRRYTKSLEARPQAKTDTVD